LFPPALFRNIHKGKLDAAQNPQAFTESASEGWVFLRKRWGELRSAGKPLETFFVDVFRLSPG
jgi:hypothetical protein